MIRRILVLAAAVAVVLAVAGSLLIGFVAQQADGAPAASTAKGGVGGPFTLATHTGGTLSDTDLKGTPFAVFFGFTHCPEICPTTLWEMSTALGELGADGDRLKVLFVTVDPERDTAAFLSDYLGVFDPRIVGLIGDDEDLEALRRDYRVFWEKVPLEGSDYTMNHSAAVYLMDAQGDFAGTIAYGETAEARLAKLRALIDG